MAARIGIIGTGTMAQRMAQCIKACDLGSIVGVVSSTHERAKAFVHPIGGAEAFDDVEALIKTQSPDCLYIANKTADHGRMVEIALAHKIPVLCEKPLATTAEETRTLIALAHKHGTLLMENYWILLLPAFLKMREMVSGGSMGAPRHFEMRFTGFADPALYPGLYDKDGGGVILDRTGYLIAAALTVMGADADLAFAHVTRTADIADHAHFGLTHNNGAQSALTASLSADWTNSVHVSAENASLSMPLIGLASEQLMVSEHVRGQQAPHEFASPSLKGKIVGRLRQSPLVRKLKNLLPKRAMHVPYGRDEYEPAFRHFLSLVAAGAKESPVLTYTTTQQIADLMDRVKEG